MLSYKRAWIQIIQKYYYLKVILIYFYIIDLINSYIWNTNIVLWQPNIFKLKADGASLCEYFYTGLPMA
jgi:hypothetical protein